MVSLVLPLVVLTILFSAFRVYSLWQSRQAARKTGLPYTYSPVHELETWAYLTDPLLRWLYADYLMKGKGWPRWARFMVKDWMYEDKGRAHEEFGDVFLVVSPAGMICYTADAQLALDVCTRRKDFIKPREKMKMIEPFGPNVVSSEGNLWRFHVRITAPPFGDAANRLVWGETMRQTEFLVSSWSASGSMSLKSDIYLLGVNVMACAGFGRRIDWTDDTKAAPEGHETSLVGSIFGVVMYLPYILLLPQWLLKRSPWKAGYTAYKEFEQYMREFIAVEKARIASGTGGESKTKGNLLTAMLATSADEEKNMKQGAQRTSFTDDEVLGNIFMFFMAGYDTTANTIIFSCVVLALDEDLQEQVIKEADKVFEEAAAEGRDQLSYTYDFPKFKYMLAFMYETLRVYPVVLPIGRITPAAQSITIPWKPHSSTSSLTTTTTTATKTHFLPPDCGVIVNNTGVHYNSKYWPSPHVLSPPRWLSPTPNTYDPIKTDAVPEHSPAQPFTARHARGTFMTFSEGPRACLGKKFAMAEFVAFFASVLRNHRIRLAEGVGKEHVERFYRLRSAGSPITLAPPGDVPLRLVSRKG